jgi:hypothetical protein
VGAQDGLGGSKAERVGDSLGSPISEQQGHADAGEVGEQEQAHNQSELLWRSTALRQTSN